MSGLTIVLPWEALVSDNRRYVKGHILSKQYREARARAAAIAIETAAKAKWRRTVKPVRMDVAIIEPDRRRRDLNFSKALKDAISQAGTIWEDDAQVRAECWQFTGRDKDKAGAVVRITFLEG